MAPGPDAEFRTATEALFEQHQQRLGAFVQSLGPPEFVYRETVCAEYSPELQLEILGLELDSMAEPVLDLGCGERARLVRYLRRHGLAAIGLDRAAVEAEHAVAADWFAVDQPRGTWGTIISHLAFSQHFLHHHLCGSPDAERYARLYMQLVWSLRAGGSFVYAPGLPFVETLLPSHRYRVARRPITLPDTSTALVPGLPLYACAVTAATGTTAS